MYKEWLKEYHKIEVYETEYGFLTYAIDKDVCLFSEIFISKEFRKNNKTLEIAKEVENIAKKQNCKKIISFINLPSPYPEYSLKAHINFGFKIKAFENCRVFLQKDI